MDTQGFGQRGDRGNAALVMDAALITLVANGWLALSLTTPHKVVHEVSLALAIVWFGVAVMLVFI